MRSAVTSGLVFLALLAPNPARAALDALDALAWPNFSRFGVRDGLPEAVAYDVQVDAQGYVYAGTQAGLFRYDGLRWSAAGPDASRSSIRDLYLDRQQRLWVASDTSGLWLLDQDWRSFGIDSGWPTQRYYRVQQLEDGRVFIGTTDAGALIERAGSTELSPENFERAHRAQGLLADEVFASAETTRLLGGPRLWLGTFEGGLFWRTNGAWQSFSWPGFNAGRIRDLAVVREGDREWLYIASYGNGLYRFDGKILEHYSTANGALPSDLVYEVIAVRPSGDLQVYIATKGGLVRMRGEALTRFDRVAGMPFDAVRSIHPWVSPDGIVVLWLGTENGVSRAVLNAEGFKPVAPLGAAGNGVWSVLSEGEGDAARLWVASAVEGLSRFESGRWHRYPETMRVDGSSSGARLVTRVSIEPGVVERFVGLWGGALFTVEPDLSLRELSAPWPIRDGEALADVREHTRNGARELWFALREGGLYRRLAGRFEHAPETPSQRSRFSRFLPVTRDGETRLFATSMSGLWRLDERWQRLDLGPSIAAARLLGGSVMEREGRTEIWTGSMVSGVQRIDVTDPDQPVVIAEPLPPTPVPIVYTVTPDGKGNIFVCTNSGVQRLTYDGAWRAQMYYRRNGLIHDECNGNATTLDEDGRLWIGGLGGLSVLNPRLAIADRSPKPLQLGALAIDGEQVPTLDIPSGARDASVRFSLLSWQREDESRFRTQLLGYDGQPTPWGTAPQRDFGKPPPGKYTLRIEARDYAGLLAKPLELQVTVAPAWWQTTAARIALVLCALALLAAGARFSAWSAQRRAAHLQALVDARTAQLNEALARVEALSLQDELTGVGNRRFALRALDRIASTGVGFGVIMFDLDHFKSYNDRYGHLGGDAVLRRTAQLASDALASWPQHALGRYGGEEFVAVLPGGTAAELLALAEALCAAVAAATIEHRSAPLGIVTISVGAAFSQPGSSDPRAQLDCADRALYTAKQTGRHRAVLA